MQDWNMRENAQKMRGPNIRNGKCRTECGTRLCIGPTNSGLKYAAPMSLPETAAPENERPCPEASSGPTKWGGWYGVDVGRVSLRSCGWGLAFPEKMQYFLLKCTLVHFQRADVEIAWMQQHTVLCSYQSYYRPIRPILLKLVNRYNSENFRVKCKGLQCQIVCKLKIRANQQTTTLEWINSLYGSLNNKLRALPTATMTI